MLEIELGPDFDGVARNTHPVVVDVISNYWGLSKLFENCTWEANKSGLEGWVNIEGSRAPAYYKGNGDYEFRFYFKQIDLSFALALKLKYDGVMPMANEVD